MNRKNRDIVLGCCVAAILVLVAGMSTSAFGRGTKRTSAASSSAGPVVGIISGIAGFGDSALGGRYRQVERQTHTKWLRANFLWSQIEPRRGVFRFRHYDDVVLTAARNGQHLLVMLDNAPRWAAPSSISVPTDPAAYAQFVAAVAHRYASGGPFWSTVFRLLHGSAAGGR